MDYGHGGNIIQFSEQNSIDKNDIIDFSSNVNWWGPPVELLELIKNNVNQIIHYPHITNKILIKRFSEFYELAEEFLITGNGSAELLFLLVDTLEVESAYIIEPNFSEYRQAVEANKLEVKSIIGREENNFKVPISEILTTVQDNSVLFISTPNNPVGYVYTENEILHLAEELGKKNSYLFVDEAFIDFVKPSIASSVIKLIDKYKNLIVLRSITKILAIPGLRLGILAANPEMISKMKKVQPPWSVNYFAQLAGENIFHFTDFINESLIRIFEEKKRISQILNYIGFMHRYDSEANFILFKLKNSMNVSDLQKFLAVQNIMIRNCKNYRGLDDNYFRIAIRKEKDNNLLIKVIKDYFCV